MRCLYRPFLSEQASSGRKPRFVKHVVACKTDLSCATFIVGVITTAWTYSFVDNIAGAVAPFVLGILVALVAPRTTRR